ncbi:MAG: isoleucine--tRNA ligase [Thermoanaerobaculales bacterium]|jgi:isoleucyl-tRNA synthetase|nr:isoleucine--tRNA ligase [Thermoanaerobaculales bacterium]
MSAETKKDRYRETLQLPQTEFSMRAGLLEKEPRFQERWQRIGLYRRQQEQPHPAGPFVFHDGPPYANGNIHMGHLINKILKDLVVRSRQMAGHEVRFVPGWDCHGLPIEHKVMKELGDEAAGLGTMEIRRRCHDYAAGFQRIQAGQMMRLGTTGDYDDPYLTMHPAYEGAVLEVFAALVGRGLVYRDLKPVHWSIENRTALADAELEYHDRRDDSVFVLFPIVDPAELPAGLAAPAGEAVDLMIWTTTPWTLPANLAVAVGPVAEYGLYRLEHGGGPRLAVIAVDLAGKVLGGAAAPLGRCRGAELADAGVRYRHPFVDRVSPVVTADYVTLEDGTGLVHTAPGHGQEDYETGLRVGLDIYCPVREDGTFDATAPEWLQGLDVWRANPKVVETLAASGHLFRRETIVHSYPHDWRSKGPTIFRATEQWFVGVDRPFGDEAATLRERALDAAAHRITFVPEWGQKRFAGMLESRPDWCISRQRSWGLPIPAFHGDGGVLLTEASVRAVAAFVRARGSDAWFTDDPQAILAGYDPAADPAAPAWLRDAGRDGLAPLVKGSDIFDVWFESGSSWNAVMRERGIGYPCDLYLEGSDQHRGWFQLSLLPALGMTGRPPFETVLTHGFMVTAEGEKMSKSLGNAIEVEDLLKEHGADVCRWWTASLNYTHDMKVDWEYFRVASDEYRKVRNTLRFMIGNLADFDPATDRVELEDADRTSLDWWAADQLARLVAEVREAYDGYRFKRVAEAIFTFCNDTMSSVYMAATKDRLYCDPASSRRRRRTQTVLWDAATALLRLVAPILVHTADEAWLALTGRTEDDPGCVHLEELPAAGSPATGDGWQAVMTLRAEVLKRLEEAKEAGIKNTLDAGVVATVEPSQLELLAPYAAELADLCGVSRFDLAAGPEPEARIVDLRDEPRCERSWKRDGTVRERSDGGWLSDRDAAAVGVA